VKIKLLDLRRIVRLAQLFEAHCAERRNAEHCTVFRSRSCDGAFTLMVKETLQGGGRAIDRQSKLLAHDGDGEINVLYAAQDAGYEVTALEGFRITPVSHLVIGGAVDVIEYWSGQPSLGETPEIMKVVTICADACGARTVWEASSNLASQRPHSQTPNRSARVRKRLDACHV
jgi:hypothetical protein